MNPELARKLRDEVRHRSHGHHGLARSAGTDKRHRLCFDTRRPEQAEQVFRLLEGIAGLVVSQRPGNCLLIEYNLTEYTLAGLEKALVTQGFQLSDRLVHRVQRALIHFWEETQLRNMRMPERLLKKSNEVYVKAWEQHPHGDHDDTPTDLREER